MDVAGKFNGRELVPADFADITPVPVLSIGWVDGLLSVSFESDLTPAQVQRVRLRITSSDASEEQMRVALAAYLTLDTPTNAQTLAALKRTIRLLLALGDG